MSVRQAILALLAEQPMHGYQLRQQFERRTGGTWPLNIGQVYTTVQRLVRDGLVEPSDDAAGPSESGAYVERLQLTPAGVAEVGRWWSTPVTRGAPARDELVIKLAMAVTSAGVDAHRVIQAQRTETMRAMRDYTRLARGDGGASTDLAWSLVLDSLIFAAEAEVRWLDHVEATLDRRTGAAAASVPAPPSDAGRPAAATDVIARAVTP